MYVRGDPGAVCCCAPPGHQRTGAGQSSPDAAKQPPSQGWPAGGWAVYYKREHAYLCLMGGAAEARLLQRIDHKQLCFLARSAVLVHCRKTGLLQLQTEASARGGASRVQSRVRGPYDAGVAGGPTPWLDKNQSQCASHDLGVVRALGENAVARRGELVVCKLVFLLVMSLCAGDPMIQYDSQV